MTEPAKFRLDGSVSRYGTTLIGGSPLKLFRLTDAGNRVVDRISAGEPVDATALVGRLLDAGVVHPAADLPGPYSADDVTIVVPTLGPPRNVPEGAIVVDDGSMPAVAGAAIRLDANAGPGAARNAGLAVVGTPLVAFVDGDVDLPAGWLERLLPHFTDPLVAAVAPRVVTPTGEASSVTTYEHRHSPLDMGSEPARVRAGTRVSYLPAAALVVRVDALASIGGFDTDLRFGEDVDLVWRLDDAGWRVRYEPSSSVMHASRTSWREMLSQRVGYGSSAGPLARRHPRKLAPLRMSGWSILAWLLTAGGRPAAGAAVGLGSALALVPKLPDVPGRDAFGLAAMGNLRAGDVIANTVRRTWWPIVAVAAIRSRMARRVLIASALAARDPRVLADDIAYSLGVWRGMIAARTLDPIVPQVTSWPGRAATHRRRATGYGRSS